MQHFETPAVEIKSLEKCYGAHRVLHSVSLQAHQGEVISILGASGSGKSTLLALHQYAGSAGCGQRGYSRRDL